jgi:hypothetical protein
MDRTQQTDRAPDSNRKRKQSDQMGDPVIHDGAARQPGGPEPRPGQSQGHDSPIEGV